MLTSFQTDILMRYLSFRREAPTVGGLMRRNVVSVGGWSLFLMLAAGALWWFGFRLGAVALLGFVASTLFHAIGNYYRTREIWPVIERITDWGIVEQLIGPRRRA